MKILSHAILNIKSLSNEIIFVCVIKLDERQVSVFNFHYEILIEGYNIIRFYFVELNPSQFV